MVLRKNKGIIYNLSIALKSIGVFKAIYTKGFNIIFILNTNSFRGEFRAEIEKVVQLGIIIPKKIS